MSERASLSHMPLRVGSHDSHLQIPVPESAGPVEHTEDLAMISRRSQPAGQVMVENRPFRYRRYALDLTREET